MKWFLILVALALGLESRLHVHGQSSYTHYVTPDGVGSLCTETVPCSLQEAVARVKAGTIGPGSVVHGAAGFYSALRLTIAGRGVSFVFDRGAVLTGTRVKPAAWVPVEGYPHVWQTEWDEAAFAVGTVAQRSPASWQPIRVDDHGPPPARVAFGRPFDLVKPVKLKGVSTLPQVEAQSGTWAASFTANRVYVHPYHDGAPTDADDLWIAPADWGSLVITGRDIRIEGLEVRNTSGTGLWVQRSAAGAILRHITAVDAQVWLEGIGTLAEDLDVSHVIKQGDPSHQECYDANPAFGMGECWNAQGDGRALLVGREGSGVSYGQTLRHIRVHRSWNGGRVDGPNTLERATFYSFPNHTLEASGQGVTVRDSVFLNGQDSLFARGAFGGWRLERNVFVNAVYITASNNGVGGVAPGAWFFERNILPAFTLDRLAYAALALSDCNVWMESGNNLYRVLDTNGVRGFTLSTLAQVKVATPHEQDSKALPSSWWTGGRLFARFDGQAVEPFDFGDPLKVCGVRAGPS